MLTKNAIGNMINRYNAVLKKCRLLNIFGTMALAGTVAVGGLGLVGVRDAWAEDDGTVAKETKTFTNVTAATGYTGTLNITDLGDTIETLLIKTAGDDSYPKAFTDLDDWETYAKGVGDAVDRASSVYSVVELGSTYSEDECYTTFTKYTANDDGTLSSTTYGVLLNTSTAETFTNTIDGYIENYTTSEGYSFTADTPTTVTSNTNLSVNKQDYYLQYNGGYVTFTATTPSADNSGLTDSDYVTVTKNDITYYLLCDGNYVATNESFDATNIYINNSATNDDGGAIKIGNSNIGSYSVISADFIANSAKTGGAIYIDGDSVTGDAKITSITGDFIGNSTTEGKGGAIANANGGIIGTITGNFIANNAYSYGTINNSGTIGTITGNFIGNYTSNFAGGAIYNYSPTDDDGIIETIIGDFIGNSASTFGGAIVNTNKDYADSVSYIYTIVGDFIGNTADSSGGAICNWANGTVTANTIIGTITGNFISNSSGNGGAIFNSGTIYSITGDFYNNTASELGGAIYNVNHTITVSSETVDELADIGVIVSNFAGNSAGTSGGAIYTEANLTFLAADEALYFTNNYTGTESNKTYNAIHVAAEGTTLYFNMGDATDDVDGTTAEVTTGDDGCFIMNDSITGSSKYYIVIQDIDQNAVNEGDNIFYLNDDIDQYGYVTVTDATLILGNYTHDDDSLTIGDLFFYAADTNASYSGLMGTNAILKVDVGVGNTVYVGNSTDSNGDAIDEILSVGSDDQFIVTSGTFDISAATLSVASDATYETDTDGILRVNIANYGYYVVSGDNTLTYNGTTPTDSSQTIGGETVEDLIAQSLDNDGELVLVYDSLTISKVDYINLIGSLDIQDWTEAIDEDNDNAIIASGSDATDAVTVDFTNLTLTGYYSLNTFYYNDDTVTGDNQIIGDSDYEINGTTTILNEFVMAGDLATGSNLTAAGIVINDEEFDTDVTESTIVSGATLTLTGETFYVANADTTISTTNTSATGASVATGSTTDDGTKTKTNESNYIVGDADTALSVTNYGTLYLGAVWEEGEDADEPVGVDYGTIFNGTLTTASTGKTIAKSAIEITGAIESAGTTTFEGNATLKSTLDITGDTTTFASTGSVVGKTTVSTAATLTIDANNEDVNTEGANNTVTMAGLDISTGSDLNINSGTLELEEMATKPNATTTATDWNDATLDTFNDNVATIIALDYDINVNGADNTDTFSDSNIDGVLTMASGSALVVDSGITNIVGAELSVANDTSTTITITDTGTLVAGFDDFVTGASDSADAADAANVTNADSETSTLAMTTLADHVTLDSDDATLILDGEEAYINKEDFAEFLTGDDWTKFVEYSTGYTADLAIDYGADGTPDTGDYTLDNTYTYDTDNGTITITNLHLTSYYSLTYYLANANTDGDYILAEPVIAGDLTGGTSLVAPTLLQGSDQTSTIASDSSLTLTGASYLDEDGQTVANGVLVNGGSVENAGTLILGDSGTEYTSDLEFDADLTTNATGTTTAYGPITISGDVTNSGTTTFEGKTTITGAVESSGTTTFTGEAELKDSLTITGGTTSLNAGGSVVGTTAVSGDATLEIGGDTTMNGVEVASDSTFTVTSGIVTLTDNSTFAGELSLAGDTGIIAAGVEVTIAAVDVETIEDEELAPYIYASTIVDENDATQTSSITVTNFEKDADGNYILDFSAYADDGSDLIFGTLDTDNTEYDYIMSQVDNADSLSLLYVGLDTTLTMTSGTNIVVGGSPLDVDDDIGLYFGENSLFIADMAGIDDTEAVISGDGNTLTVVAGSSLGLINASEGEYIILQDFTVSADATVPWDEDSVTIGNYLLAVDSVTGTGTTADPYKVTVRQDVDETLYSADGGGALADVMNSGEYKADTTNALAKYLYEAANQGGEALKKAQANTASAGANSGSNASGMTAARSSAATFDVRNTIVHVGSVSDAGGTLLVKDANGKVTAEYENVIEVADSGSISDAPAALGGAGSGIGNSLGVWAMPFYAHESISGAKVGSYKNDMHTDMYGVTMGVDKTFTPKGLDVVRLGVAFNIGTGETEGYGYTGSSENEFDFVGVAAYGSMRKGKATLSGSLSYTNTDGEFNSAGITGETDTDVWYGILNAEYGFDLGNLEDSAFFSNFHIEPYVGIGFMTSKTDDYTTSLGSSVESDRQNVFTFPVGIKFNKEFEFESGWILEPQIGGGVILADGDLYQRSATGNTLGSSLDVIKSQVMDKTTMELDLSLDVRKDNFGVFLDYVIQKSDIRTAHGVSAKFELRF